MKLVISGSRDYNNKDVVWNALENSRFTNVTTLLSGHARGVDLIGEEWAKSKSIPIELYIPHYQVENPKLAPLLRNITMAEHGDALVAIWNHKSHGTEHMINQMIKQKKPCYIVEIYGDDNLKEYFESQLE